jgi:NAD(P)-dependent dehydrogenase (short-subunit alcohol dehydrogenase family)
MSTSGTPTFGLDGKTVLITGAARGIGRACAIACAGSGADVVVGVRKPSDGEALAEEIERKLGRRALAVQIDLADLTAVRVAVERGHRVFGRIDVLVNNVGIGPENLAENVTEEDFDYTVGINLKGTFFTTQAVGRLMIAQKSGRIVNISSQAGTVTLKGEAIYCMTKAAINHLTRCLAAE